MNPAEHSNVHFSEELLSLIKQGESERVKEILQESHCFYHATDTSGATLLHYSARHNNANLTQHLLNKGCDANAQDSMGNTPLMIAMMENREEITRNLLTAGADVLKSNKQNKSALHLLSTQHAMRGSTIQLFLHRLFKKCSTREEMAEKLIDAGCHLYQAAAFKDAGIIEYMLKRGDLATCGNTHPTNKATAMHVAAVLDDLKTVNALLNHGADPNALDCLNTNPLHHLYQKFSEHNREKIEILKILLNRGASMTSCTSTGAFQATHALMKGNRETIRLLIDSGLDFNARDKQSGKIVLHYVASNFDSGVIEELKLHADKFDVDACDRFGQTPLLVAAFEGNVGMVRFLLKRGARTDLKRRALGITPLYYAYAHSKPGFEKQYCLIGEMLLQHNADPQFIMTARSGATVTVFDAALAKNDIDRIKPVIAHLALIEKRGIEIIETTWAKINSHEKLTEYFDKCRRLLTEKVAGRVRLFDLLTSDKRKMARYLNNKNIVRRLEDKSFKRKMQRCWYFHNDLCKRYLEGKRYKKLKDKAAKTICKMFRNRIDRAHLIIDNMTDYLNDQSLRNLCNARLSRSISKKSASAIELAGKEDSTHATM